MFWQKAAHVTPKAMLSGGMVFQVLDRGVCRRVLFAKDENFLAFERVVEETLRSCRIRLCAYCLVPNHWHFVVSPEHDGDLPAFMQQMTNTHVTRWKAHRQEFGYGHLYQGRYKCFPVETAGSFTDDTESQAMARFAVVEQPDATASSSDSMHLLREVASRLQAQVKPKTQAVNPLHNLRARVFPELATLTQDITKGWVLQEG